MKEFPIDSGYLGMKISAGRDVTYLLGQDLDNLSLPDPNRTFCVNHKGKKIFTGDIASVIQKIFKNSPAGSSVNVFQHPQNGFLALNGGDNLVDLSNTNINQSFRFYGIKFDTYYQATIFGKLILKYNSYLSHYAQIVFDSCFFKNTTLELNTVQRVIVDKCKFSGVDELGVNANEGLIKIVGDSVNGVYSLENVISRCILNNSIQNTAPANVPYGIILDGYSSDNKIVDNEVGEVKYGSGIKLNYSSSNIIKGNTLWGNKYAGLSLSNAHHNTITGNRIDNNLQHGIYMINSNDNVFVGNSVYKNSQEAANTYYNIYVDAGCYANVFNGNKIRSSNTFTEQVKAEFYALGSNNNWGIGNIASEDLTIKRRLLTFSADGINSEFVVSNPFGSTNPLINIVVGVPVSPDAISAKLLAIQIETVTNTGDSLRIIFQNVPPAGTDNIKLNLLRIWTDAIV